MQTQKLLDLYLEKFHVNYMSYMSLLACLTLNFDFVKLAPVKITKSPEIIFRSSLLRLLEMEAKRSAQA